MAERQRGERHVHRKCAARRRARDRVPVARTGMSAWVARNARSSPVAGSTPGGAGDNAATGRRATSAQIVPHIRSSMAWRRARLCGLARSDSTAVSRASGLAPRASAWLARLDHQEGAERAEREAAAAGRAARPARTCPCRLARRTRRAAACPGARSCCEPPTSAMSLWPAVMRASAIRTASTPADSSPMKVRDEPVTPCTIEMLPASRFESCARNSVGRRSLISRSLRNASGSAALSHAGQDRAVDRHVALAAAGGDDHVGAREDVGVALDAGACRARGRPRRCRCAATAPSGADRPSWGSACRDRAARADARRRARRSRCRR